MMNELMEKAESGREMSVERLESMVQVESSGSEKGGESVEKLVPVTESIRYRRRAQSAERRAAELEAKFAETEEELANTRSQLENAERRRRVDQLLIEADAIDLETARLLTEATIESMDEVDVGEVVDDLRSRKPYLFRQGDGGGGGVMSARLRGGGSEVERAANDAVASGDRRDLLTYLRMRRRA